MWRIDYATIREWDGTESNVEVFVLDDDTVQLRYMDGKTVHNVSRDYFVSVCSYFWN